jgi:hypothetical protein
VHLHNDIMLGNLANAMRDNPPVPLQNLGWIKRSRDGSTAKRGSLRAKLIKREVMGLSGKERRRLKSISADAVRLITPLTSTLIENRNAKLPRIPTIRDKINPGSVYSSFHSHQCSDST